MSSADPAPKAARTVFRLLASRRRASKGPGTQLPWRRWPFAKRRKVTASRSSLIQRWSWTGTAFGFSACRQACLPKDMSLPVAYASQLHSIESHSNLAKKADAALGPESILASRDTPRQGRAQLPFVAQRTSGRAVPSLSLRLSFLQYCASSARNGI